ncbi:MAG: tetratricopeptide repeat protein [Thermodesulfobacteriota bacterium]
MVKKQILKLLLGSLSVCLSILIFSGCATMQSWFSFLSDSDDLKTAEQIDKKDFKQFMASVKPVKGNADNQYKLARHFQKQNRHEIAVEELLKVLKIDPEYFNAYNALGVSYDHLKQHDLAIDAYRAALKINQELDYVYNNIGYSNLLKGNTEAAAKAFEKAIAINGHNKIYQNNLALANVKSGENNVQTASVTSDSYKLDEQKIHPVIINTQLTSEELSGIIDKAVGMEIDMEIESAPEKLQAQAAQSSTDAENYYAVQLGVSYDLNKAVQMLNNARKNGNDCPYIIKVAINKPYYRVRFGKFKTRSEAVIAAAENPDKQGRPALIYNENYPMEVFHAEIEKECKGFNIQQTVLNQKLNIEVLNGNGIYHMAARVSKYFEQKGFKVVKSADAGHFNYLATKIYYAPGYYQDAEKLGREIPGFATTGEFIESTELTTNIRVLIGKDIISFNDDLKKSLKI